MSDIRAQQVREHHQVAARLQEQARRHRMIRDRLIRQLRAEDPRRWTYRALAAELGCSHQLVMYIVGQGGEEMEQEGERHGP